MKNVLVLAYHFPPVAGGGVFRTLKFVKYLPACGWQPTVLTVNRSKFSPVDGSLLTEVPNQVRVERTYSLESRALSYGPGRFGIGSNWYMLPDIMIGWYPFALRRGKKIADEESANVIFSTAPPYTAALVGAELKRRTGLPLVLDFRDPWTLNPERTCPSRYHRKIDERLERDVLALADKIVVTTEVDRLDLLGKYPRIDEDKCVTLTNGYDPQDFEAGPAPSRGKFRISHVGSFYGRQTPEHFLEAVKEAIDECAELARDLEIVFAGQSSKEYWGLGKRFGLDGLLVEKGYIAHKDAIQLIRGSSCLLLIVGLGKRSNSVYTGKVFEYLASGRPIIATVPIEGISSDLIRATRSGRVANTDDVEAIKRIILDYYRSWRSNTLTVDTDWDAVRAYDRRSITKKLADIFDEVAEV